MNKLSEIIKNKMGSRTGMSLSEMLVTLIILGLSTSVLASAFSVGLKTYRAEKRESALLALQNALVVSIEDELRYATGFSNGGSSFTYSSRNRAGGRECSLVSDASTSNRIKVKDSAGNYYNLISDSMYVEDTKSFISFSYSDFSKINVTVTITNGNKEPMVQTFMVKPLNIGLK